MNNPDLPSPIERLLERLQRENPEIRPYGEDDWDWTWADEGMELLDGGDTLLAEKKFEELIVAQPEHPDGYEGLALVYERLGRKAEAVVLMRHAVHLAQKLVERDWLDADVLEAIVQEQRRLEQA
mgnify:CR=1 FL=1